MSCRCSDTNCLYYEVTTVLFFPPLRFQRPHMPGQRSIRLASRFEGRATPKILTGADAPGMTDVEVAGTEEEFRSAVCII